MKRKEHEMGQCKRCNSHAINLLDHGRDPNIDLDLCDVCYWRKRAEDLGVISDDLERRNAALIVERDLYEARRKEAQSLCQRYRDEVFDLRALLEKDGKWEGTRFPVKMTVRDLEVIVVRKR